MEGRMSWLSSMSCRYIVNHSVIEWKKWMNGEKKETGVIQIFTVLNLCLKILYTKTFLGILMSYWFHIESLVNGGLTLMLHVCVWGCGVLVCEHNQSCVFPTCGVGCTSKWDAKTYLWHKQNKAWCHYRWKVKSWTNFESVLDTYI